MPVVEVVETTILIVQGLEDQVVVEQVQQDLVVLQQVEQIEEPEVAVVEEAQVVLFQIMELMVVLELLL
jgi:hypothetical protein|tara:strand:+ start:540 stop:746 length:207 start_codon:yes stop_codon:yes gene_type:complete